MIEILNIGEIPIEAFTLMCASTKKGDNTKIGYFGSGLKYAISRLMRENIKLEIYSGEKQVKITTRKVAMGEHTFERINIGGKQTSLTTEMGPDWKLWQAIREIYCNAIDAGEHAVNVGVKVSPEKDKTKFYIDEVKETQEIIQNWNKYFSGKRSDLIVRNNEIEIFSSGENMAIYRKGIRCYDSVNVSLYDYNFDLIEINESRVVGYNYQLSEKVADAWGKYATKDMIRNLFNRCRDDIYERNVSWSNVAGFNEFWLDIIDGRILIYEDVSGYFTYEQENCEHIILPSGLLTALKKFFGDKIKVAEGADHNGTFLTVRATKKQEYLIKETLEFFDEVGLKISWPIEIAMFEDKKVCGKASNQKIFLSPHLFEMGRKVIASTILEEAFHLESGLRDETRGFQDYIVNKIITLLENKNALFL